MFRLAVPLSFLSTAAVADPGEGWHMMDGGYGHGYGMMFGPVLWLIVLGLVVVGVIWIVRSMEDRGGAGGKSAAAAELDLRFARGEIDADDYSARKKLLNS